MKSQFFLGQRWPWPDPHRRCWMFQALDEAVEATLSEVKGASLRTKLGMVWISAKNWILDTLRGFK